MGRLDRYTFENFVQPALVAAAVIGIVVGFVVSYFAALTGIAVGVAVVAVVFSIRNWLYFSLLDVVEIRISEPLIAVTPWLGVVLLASSICIYLLSISLEWSNRVHWGALIGVSLFVWAVNVWYPHRQRALHFQRSAPSLTEPEEYRRLKKEYYSLLGERQPPNWDAFNQAG